MEKHKDKKYINEEMKQIKKGRIEMKVKTKSIVVLMIVLFAVLLLGTTKVNAVSITEDYLQNMLDVLPSEINIDMSEYEAGSDWLKASEILEKKVEEIWIQKGIDEKSVKNEGFSINIYSNPIYLCLNSVNEFYTASIDIHDDNIEKNRVIKLTYNNSSKRNTSDETVVKNLKIQVFPYAIYDFMSGKDVRDYYSVTSSDKNVQIVKSAGAGGEDFIHNIGGEGLRLGIFKNNILYDIKRVGKFEKIGQITIPSTVAEQDYISYATKIIKEKLKIENITITKGARTSGNASVEIENGYTVTRQTEDGKETSAIILKKETSNAVTKEDTATGIKLETTTVVVPSDVVLSSTKVTEPKILDIVKTSLKDISNKYTVFDINLLQNNVKIQPSGKVKVSIPVPSDYIKEKLVVYRIAENGTKTKYDVKVEGNYATFETDHFSTYVLAEVTTKATTTNNDKKELDETPKTGTIDMIYYILPVTIISALGIVLFKKKQTK